MPPFRMPREAQRAIPRFGAGPRPLGRVFLPFAGFPLIRFAWWPTLAMLENIRHGDTYLQFDVVANGGGAGLGLWPNGL